MDIRTIEDKLNNFDDCLHINSLCLHLTQVLHNLKIKVKFTLIT